MPTGDPRDLPKWPCVRGEGCPVSGVPSPVATLEAQVAHLTTSLEGAIRRIKALESEQEPDAPDPLWKGTVSETVAELSRMSLECSLLTEVLNETRGWAPAQIFAAVAVALARENARLRAGDE